MPPTTATDRTPEQQRMVTRLQAFERKYAKVAGVLADLEAERSRLYVEARELDPPVTFRDIAGVFGVTEAAVMQKIKRHQGTGT